MTDIGWIVLRAFSGGAQGVHLFSFHWAAVITDTECILGKCDLHRVTHLDIVCILNQFRQDLGWVVQLSLDVLVEVLRSILPALEIVFDNSELLFTNIS